MKTVIDTLITNRTNEDLVRDTDRAYISYEDLNRLEEACVYLAGIFGTEIQTKVWTMGEFRTETEAARIRDNIRKLRGEFYLRPGTPMLPGRITWESIYQANQIEQILFDIDYMQKSMINGFQRVGFKLGCKSIGNRRS